MNTEVDYRGFTLDVSLDLKSDFVFGEIEDLLSLDKDKYRFYALTISDLKKKFYQLVDERIEELGQDIFATGEGRFGLPAININGTEYLVDSKSRHWYRWGKRGVVPEYLSTAIEYKLYKLDSSIISDAIVCLSQGKEIVESIQLNENKVGKLYINQILRFLIEVYPGNWYYFCKNVVDSKSFAYFFSSDEISKFEPEDLFGDSIPDELLKILDIDDMVDFQVLSPVFYLF